MIQRAERHVRVLWPRSLRHYARRHFLRHRLQTLLALLGIALGVSAPVAVDLASHSARQALGQSLAALFGSSTHQLLANSGGVPVSVYVSLRRELGLRRAAPVIHAELALGGETFVLLGSDPLVDLTIRETLWSGRGEFDLAEMTTSDSVLMSAAEAERRALQAGDTLEVRLQGQPRVLVLAGTFAAPGPAAERVLLADIAVAGALLGSGAMLDRIDLQLTEEQVRRLQEWLPDGYRLVATAARSKSIGGLSRAFHINLQAMSLLALLVGAYLIYNTLSFAVLQRRGDFGILRALGATPGNLSAAVCFETMALALLGALAGIALGVFLARGLLLLVVRTMDDLYHSMPAAELLLSGAATGKGLLLGVGVALLAAVAPARQAASVPAAHTLAIAGDMRPVAATARAAAWVGIVLVSLCLLSLLFRGGLLLAYLQLALLVFGYGLLLPALFARSCLRLAVTRRRRRCPVLVTAALRELARRLDRSGSALVALTVALAATIGTGVMIDSFRGSVQSWLGDWLSGDLYLSVAGDGSESARPVLPAGLDARLLQMGQVQDVERRRFRRMPVADGALQVLASSREPESLPLLTGLSPAQQRDYRQGRGVLISEPMARRRGLAPGSRLSLPTASGPMSLSVLAVFRDYSSDRGFAVLPLSLYQRLWQDPGLSSLIVHVAAGVEVARLQEQLRQELPGSVRVVSRQDIRAASLRVFDRTFAVTGVLRTLIVVVAVVGVLSALMALELERRRDSAMLRALGATPTQGLLLTLTMALTIGLAAGLFAQPLGIAMAWILTEVINREAFGWTLDFRVAVPILLHAILAGVVAALAGAAWPAWRATRISPVTALRSE